jgi:holin-like protein
MQITIRWTKRGVRLECCVSGSSTVSGHRGCGKDEDAGGRQEPLEEKGAFLKNILLIAGQTFLLWVIYSLGTWIVTYFHIPLPGSVLGILILFVLLSLGVIRERWLSAAVNPLLKHLSFFFIPIAVELMQWGDLFIKKGHLLFLPLVLSTLVALLATGGVVELFSKSNKEEKE